MVEIPEQGMSLALLGSVIIIISIKIVLFTKVLSYGINYHCVLDNV